jgi:hypothetical protein
MTPVEKQTNLFPRFSDEEYVSSIASCVGHARTRRSCDSNFRCTGLFRGPPIFRIISRNHSAGFWFPVMEKRLVLFTSSIISRVLKPNRLFPMCAGTGLRYADAREEIRRKALDKCRIGS